MCRLPFGRDAIERRNDALSEMFIRADEVCPEAAEVFLEGDLLCVVSIPVFILAAQVIPDFGRAEAILCLRRDQNLIVHPAWLVIRQ